jgi:hypothetical protein
MAERKQALLAVDDSIKAYQAMEVDIVPNSTVH